MMKLASTMPQPTSALPDSGTRTRAVNPRLIALPMLVLLLTGPGTGCKPEGGPGTTPAGQPAVQPTLPATGPADSRQTRTQTPRVLFPPHQGTVGGKSVSAELPQ